ncbi:MAG: LysE family translocator [Anaerolineae bacterium]|nr:LysE family translocator [Anaerolineae bacterium]
MPDFATLMIFVTATMLLLITPGPAVLYIITRSIDQGRLAGIVSAFGVGTGTMFHVAGASLGLSAILVSSALAYSVVKYLGAAYLIYLGIRKFMGKSELEQPELNGQKSLSRIFTQGVIVNIFNPKTALFFFAFLPQFADPARGAVALQILFLGVLFVVLGIFSDSGYALLAGTAGQWLKSSTVFLRGQRYFSGTIYMALGLTTALSGSNGKS